MIALHTMMDDNRLLCDVHHASQPRKIGTIKVLLLHQKVGSRNGSQGVKKPTKQCWILPYFGCGIFQHSRNIKSPSGTRLFPHCTIKNFTVVFSTPGRKCSFGGDVMGLQNSPSPVRTHWLTGWWSWLLYAVNYQQKYCQDYIPAQTIWIMSYAFLSRTTYSGWIPKISTSLSPFQKSKRLFAHGKHDRLGLYLSENHNH